MATPDYRERLTPNWWTYITIGLVIPAIVLVATPIHPPIGLAVGIPLAVATYLCVIGALLGTAPKVHVGPDRLVAGRATLPLTAIADVTVLRGTDAQRALRTDLDARAYLVIRGWVRDLVRIDLHDPTDPTPYWLVSTRHPDALAAALHR